jgi:hypothetical protein
MTFPLRQTLARNALLTPISDPVHPRPRRVRRDGTVLIPPEHRLQFELEPGAEVTWTVLEITDHRLRRRFFLVVKQIDVDV